VTTGGGPLLAGVEGEAVHGEHAELGDGAGPGRHEDEDDD